MENTKTPEPFLTRGQVAELNAKHGWLEHGDAQSDVSRAFAQDAIAMHERMRAAAPDLLAALFALYSAIDSCVEMTPELMRQARAAINKATGSAL